MTASLGPQTGEGVLRCCRFPCRHGGSLHRGIEGWPQQWRIQRVPRVAVAKLPRTGTRRWEFQRARTQGTWMFTWWNCSAPTGQNIHSRTLRRLVMMFITCLHQTDLCRRARPAPAQSIKQAMCRRSTRRLYKRCGVWASDRPGGTEKPLTMLPRLGRAPFPRGRLFLARQSRPRSVEGCSQGALCGGDGRAATQGLEMSRLDCFACVSPSPNCFSVQFPISYRLRRHRKSMMRTGNR